MTLQVLHQGRDLFDWFCTFFMLEGKNGCGGTDKEHTDWKLANSGSCIVTIKKTKVLVN